MTREQSKRAGVKSPEVEVHAEESNTVLLYRRSGTERLGASYARAFHALGWEVERYDSDPDAEDLDWWLRSRAGRWLTRRSLGLRRWGTRRRNVAFREMALELRPDLVLLVNGAFIMPETVAAIRDSGTRLAIFHPDAPVPENQNHRPEHLPCAREADVTFIWSRKLGARLEEEGAGRVVYLPFAWDPEVYPQVEEPGEDGPEVIFVGGWDPYRERWLEPVAKRFNLAIWGPDYWGTRTRDGSFVRNSWRGRALRGREAAEAVARADIALNVLRDQNLPDGTNMRTFEVPGAGGFLLATRTSGAAEIYPEGEAGAYFGSKEELLSKITYYLEHSTERGAIGRRAHEITARAHRYVHRARRIVETVELASQ